MGAFWAHVRRIQPALLIIDPASVALEGATVNETGPVRAFMAGLRREAARAGCAVLLVAHSTKAGRNAITSGEAPDAGAIAGSAAWFDAARGVLVLVPHPSDPKRKLLECVKANHGPAYWAAELEAATTEGGSWAGLMFAGKMYDGHTVTEMRREAKRTAEAKAKATRERNAAAKVNGSAEDMAGAEADARDGRDILDAMTGGGAI